MKHYLPQVDTIKTRIESVVSSLEYIQNEQIKNNLMGALVPFENGIAPAVITIEQIVEHANKLQVSLSRYQAISILKNICLDIKLNCVNDSLSYPFDEFISDKDESELKNLCIKGAISLPTQN